MEKTKELHEVEERLGSVYELVLYNDDFNTFDYVIDCLIDICDHDLMQAEQCTMIVHYKGKCTVKSGDMEDLKPRLRKLISKGLTAQIE
jgi:ATP-dependent Clp protease adaptor protein ClpS